MPIKKTEVFALANGLRVAYSRVPGANVEYCGLVVKAGSRDDGSDPGIAHFVEHTLFKGTARRSSWHIINRMERVGGELNAYTSKEETVVYTAAPSGNLSRAVELLADLVMSSRFPQHELDKEREVVADEINSYLDVPADAVFDDFEAFIFRDKALGHNILGSIDSLAGFDSQRCRDYVGKWYTASNMTFFYCGSASIERVAATAERYFDGLSTADPRRLQQTGNSSANDIAAYSNPQFSLVKNIDSHQSHTVMGAVIEGMYSPSRHAMALLTNILGGPGMNSRLNVALREKRGYVYSVEASASLLTDCGLFTVYFGCDASDTDKCQALVRDEIARLAATPLSPLQLAQAKKQYKGQLAVASDNRENVAINIGRAAMFYGEVLPASQRLALIDAITAADLQEAASQLPNLSTLTLR